MKIRFHDSALFLCYVLKKGQRENEACDRINKMKKSSLFLPKLAGFICARRTLTKIVDYATMKLVQIKRSAKQVFTHTL